MSANVATPAYLATPLPRCAIVLDRHTHKNGGSTMRSIFADNDRLDGWVYWGYSLNQQAPFAQRLVAALQPPRGNGSCFASERSSLRVIAEHHYGRRPLIQTLSNLGPGSPLWHVAAGCGCRLVTVTRLRRPLDFYVSFYRWTVAWRQKRNATRFGATMREWLPRNLQASLLLTPIDAAWAEHVGVRDDAMRWKRAHFWQFDDAEAWPAEYAARRRAVGSARPLGAPRRAQLRGALSAFSLVGLVERFDETLLLLADLAGLQRLNYVALRPRSTNPRAGQPERSAPTVCGADEAACEAAVAAAAPLDTAIYAEAAAAFDARVAALGAPFAARLAAFRAARDAYAEPPERERRWLDIKRGGGEMYAAQVPMNRLRCAFGASAAERHACAGLYADSPFRYNWRLRPAQCCARLRDCLATEDAARAAKAAGQPRRHLLRSVRWCIAQRRAVDRGENATDPSDCDAQCVRPATPPPVGEDRPVAVAASSGCADAYPGPAAPFAPFDDFKGCADEARQELHRAHATPCAASAWMRANCRKSCGLCDLELRDALALTSSAARMRASAALKVG